MAHGGKRSGAGRKQGAPNKATASLKEFANQFTQEAVEFFVTVMRDGEAPYQARVAAANGILDRALGKPAQALTGPEGERLVPPNVTLTFGLQPDSGNKT